MEPPARRRRKRYPKVLKVRLEGEIIDAGGGFSKCDGQCRSPVWLGRVNFKVWSKSALSLDSHGLMLRDNGLSDSRVNRLRQAIARDVGAHHHHLLPSLEIDDGRIVKAQLVDGKEVVTVRLSLRGEQLVRDDASGEVVEGSTNVITWQEDWSLTRDPRVDTTGEDVELTAAGQWFIAHRGWVVTDIEGVTASVPSPSSLLI